MTSGVHVPPYRSGGKLFAKLWRLLQLLRTVDIEQVFNDLDTRQRRIEQAQRGLDAVLAQIGSRIDALLQRPDLTTSAISILDIKNLGYELGRQLAEKNFDGRVAQVDHTRLKS